MAAEQSETLSEAFWGVARELRQLSRGTFAPWDISPSQSRALSVLMRHGEMRPGALAERLRIAARSGTEVVDGLEERGLVERRPDPDDRRATLVALTEEGARVGTAIRRAGVAESERFFAVLSERDRAQLAALLQKLRARD